MMKYKNPDFSKKPGFLHITEDYHSKLPKIGLLTAELVYWLLTASLTLLTLEFADTSCLYFPGFIVGKFLGADF